MNVHLPRRICGDVRAALDREWLVTNGLGSFAMGSIAGALTRRYHGLLVAALRPPVDRTLLVAKLDDTAIVAGHHQHLYTNVWASGVELPTACEALQRFDLELGVPTWTYGFRGVRLIKRIWMEAGRQTTFVRYDLDPHAPPITLTGRLIVNCRGYHDMVTATERVFQVNATDAEMLVRTADLPEPIGVLAHADGGATWAVDYTWCHGFNLPVEAKRGFPHHESHLVVGLCTLKLEPGASATFVIGIGEDHKIAPEGALGRRRAATQDLLTTWSDRSGLDIETAPVPVTQLVLSADQFIVERPARGEAHGHTMIAGYPWFTDWGRDTMVALPGLTLVTGRFGLARQILRTWSRYVEDGLIPNRFPDEGDQPEFNTADATLWYIWAIDQYVRATGDRDTLAELFPMMQEIIAQHRRGTKHNINVGDDGLVYAGDEGVNLTWMDAKIGDRVVTPRMGKPVELSALWYDALCNMARLADLLDQPGEEYLRMSFATRGSFYRFWNDNRGCCYDVIDGPDGNDERIRPNQIFAVALTHSPLDRGRQRAIIEKCEWHLLTWFGLRSLAPEEPDYVPHFGGSPVERDEAYHQGTVWGWLLGPYVLAHYRVHKDRAYARGVLTPMFGQLWRHCVGSISEIFDATEPFPPHGCNAQAWSVAELLRAWWVTQGKALSCDAGACAPVVATTA